MVAAVTVWFGIFDIVFYFDDGDVVLFGNEIRNGVDIINKSTDNTDTGYVIELVLDILGSEVVTQFFQFLVDTFRFFDSGLDKRDRVTENSSLRTSSLVRTSRTVQRYIIIRSLNLAEFLIKTCGSGVSSQVFAFFSAMVFCGKTPFVSRFCDNHTVTIIE